MKKVVAFTLAKVEYADARFFAGLRDACASYGADFKLFSPQSHDLIRRFRLPFNWVISQIQEQEKFPSIDEIDRLPKDRLEVWKTRVAQLSLQGENADPEELVEILERFAHFVLKTQSPDVILAWNTFCPHSGILAEIARSRGIEVYLLERGFLNNTWFLEQGGLVGHSELVDIPFETLVGEREEELQDIGRSYLDSRPFEGMSRYAQNLNARFESVVARGKAAGRPLIGFFPPDDLSLAFMPSGGEDRRKHLPGHASSFEAAIALAQAAPDCDVVFKPHPSFRELDLPEQVGDNLFVIDHDYRDVMVRADVVASTGSGLIVNAMAQGKPVLQMGRDQFSFKQITYDAQVEIRPALQAALAREDLEPRLERFRTMIGYALTEYLVSGPEADAAFRRPIDVAREILQQKFGAVVSPQKLAWADARNVGVGLSRNRSAMFRELQRQPDGLLLVDFDHTLMMANSTELFLEHVRPSFVFVLVHWLVSWLVPWRRLSARGIQKHELFDPIRTVMTICLLPWSLLTWRLVTPGLSKRYTNTVLLRKLKALDPARVIIVSNGHPWLLRPLLRAMGAREWRLVCGNRLPTRTDIRRVGKLATCARRIPEFGGSRNIVITDSVDDADLLANARGAFLIDWGDRKNKADPLQKYFPFVLTTEGKYPGARVVRRHRFEEDFPVILSAFCLAMIPGIQHLPDAAGLWELGLSMGLQILALLCFFISFNVIYEIGYWENDFIAAQKEKEPNVSPQMERFRHYPLRRPAWTWALLLGAGGVVLGIASGATTPISDRIAPLLGDYTGATAGVLFGLWCLVLVGLRIVFTAHNSVEERRRIYTFWGLHLYKLFAYALLFATNIGGVIVIVAQVFRHWPNYVIYRFKGDKSASPKQEARAFFFLALTGLMLFVLPPHEVLSASWLGGALLFLTKREYWSFLISPKAGAKG